MRNGFASGCWSLECWWSLTWAPFSWRITMVAPQWLSAAWRADGQELKHQVELGWMQLQRHSSRICHRCVLFNQPWICWTLVRTRLLRDRIAMIMDQSWKWSKTAKPPVTLMVLGLIFSALMLLSILTAVFYGIGKWLSRRFRHSGPLWKVQRFCERTRLVKLCHKRRKQTDWSAMFWLEVTQISFGLPNIP